MLFSCEVLDESMMLREVHSMMNKIMKRMDGTEKEVKEIKRRLETRNTTSRCKKKDVSPVVRVSSDNGLATFLFYVFRFLFSLKQERCIRCWWMRKKILMALRLVHRKLPV